MPTITKGDVERLGRRTQQPPREADELLAFFVNGRLTNPMNERQDTRWFAGKQARYKRQWKERIALALLEVGMRTIYDGTKRLGAAYDSSPPWRVSVPAGLPKAIHFHATVPKKFDSQDGLRAALKAFPDALKECGVVNDDRDSAGHDWQYTQEASRKKPAGVEVRVRLLERAP